MNEQSKPDYDPIRLRCTRCAYVWADWLPVHVPITVAVAAMDAFRCPSCRSDARHITIRTEPDDA